MSYTIVRLNDLLNVYHDNEQLVVDILNSFECLQNKDVDRFLKEKAVVFDKQGISKTHLVFASYRSEFVLVGYFTLAIKNFVVKNTTGRKSSESLSKTLRRRIAKFSQYDRDTKQFIITAPLIGQLGKNDRYRNLISGDILLKYACDTVKEMQAIVGGKIVYLECDDNVKLTDFYTRNGFVNFGKRILDYDEKEDLYGEYLIQMLKYLK